MNAAYSAEAQPGVDSPRSRRIAIYEPYKVTEEFAQHDALGCLQDGLQQSLRSMFEANATICKLKQIFVMEPSVQAFLFERRALPILLLEAAPHLSDAFGGDVTFELKMSLDEVGARVLYAVVLWRGPATAVRAAQERFDRDWWIGSAQRSAGDLAFTYELI